VLHLTWAQRTGWTLACAALWVTLEMIQARLLSGFPWNVLGVSQHRLTPLIQIASVTGVYGLSFLIVWCSLALGLAAWRLPRTTGGRWGWMAELRLPLLAFVAVTYFGLHRLWSTQPAPDRELNLVLVQPSIPQVLIWDHRADSNRFQQVVELSRLALATQPQVLVWPEAAMPGFTEQNFQTITNLIATHRVWMVFGADDVGPRTDTPDPDDREFYNGAFLFDPQGRYVARYHKQKLVIFGEYVPLGRWLPFMKWLTPIEEGFTAGRGPVTFELGDPPCRTSVLICFEDVFPHSARRHVTPDLDFLLNLTNNGWFGRSAAQWQHAANAVFRAVENHRPLVRCTNNGLTCWIDPLGRLRQGLGLDTRDIYGPGFMTARIPLPAPGQRPPPTFYNRHGDGFGWGCVLVSGAALAIRRLPRLRR
jgi:apolipoprotein N-acyltransferase